MYVRHTLNQKYQKVVDDEAVEDCRVFVNRMAALAPGKSSIVGLSRSGTVLSQCFPAHHPCIQTYLKDINDNKMRQNITPLQYFGYPNKYFNSVGIGISLMLISLLQSNTAKILESFF